MRKHFLFLYVSLALLLFGKTAKAQSAFYAPDTIQTIEINFTEPNWDYILDTAKAGSDSYLIGQVIVNGIVFDSCGIQYKGNSSYNVNRTKNPFHIKLDYIHGNADYQSYNDIKLGNGYGDPSMQREVLAYEILRNYMAAPQSNFARVYVNGTYYGVYTNTQSIDDDFLNAHFYSSANTFFKCNPVSVIGGNIPNLVYLGQDSTQYYARYELKSTMGWQELIDLCDTIVNQPAALDSMLDIDRALWMLAYNNVLVNLDSYTGAFAQNYYLYRDDNERFCSIIWDVNMAFGGFSNTGVGNLNVSGMQQMPPMLHYNYAARPLIVTLLTDARYSKMYIAHMRTITNEFFGSGNYLTRAQQFETLIDSSVQAEQFSLYTYPQFQNALTTAVSNTPGISQLMSARTTYLNATTEFQQVAPMISNILSSPNAPALNDSIWITATVTNSSQVFIGWRTQTYNRFYRYAMYDDGLHQDGAANDNVFGAWIPAIAANMQYYIYAENANAGMFSPERAEYEFYNIAVAVQTAAAGEIVINELLASNLADTTDEAAQHEDWIELYNRAAYPLSLQGLYLTDDYTVPQKFPLPDLVMPANSYLLVWADQDQASSSNVHANFKLSTLGEQVMLSNFAGVVIDSVSFGAQTTDISYGRCPSATGPFAVFLNSTPLALNTCPASTEEYDQHQSMRVFPNPAETHVQLVFSESVDGTVELMDVQGRLVKTETLSANTLQLDVANLESGMYLILLRNREGEMMLQQRVVISH